MEIPGYEIQSSIGVGGMATAFLALQTSLGRKVVLKVLDTTHAESPETIERFLNEGRIIASLNHPYIVTIYDIGIADEVPYISMEYVEGGDLKARIATSFFTPDDALDLIRKIASALDAAHKQGIVHRDVKPGNILFRSDGTPLLSDFGIAKQLTTDHDLTSTGIFLGSPNYMAPEQAEAGPIDGRADIYSLGIIFYEMLTGAKPYTSTSVVDIILQHKQAPIPKLPQGLESYQQILELMLAKSRNNRFRDSTAMIHYIDQLKESTATLSRSQTVVLPELEGSQRDQVEIPTVRAPIESVPKPGRPKIHAVLLICLVLAGTIFATLSYVERRMSGKDDKITVRPQAVAPVPASDGKPGASGSDTSGAGEMLGGGGAPVDQEVVNALLWLGNKSLEDYRLTAPAKDNAYYYFSRLIQLDPHSEQARQGLLRVAEGFAFLAEREVANNQMEAAQNFIAIGLQVDPTNQALLTLRELAKPTERSFVQTILNFFGGDG